jgi:chromosome segregation ATPase
MIELTEIEQKAQSMGWLPKEQFRGKEENWVPADKYVERGEQFIPFLQATNRKLEGELSTVKGELNALSTTLKEATETITALKEFRTELNKERVTELQDTLVEGIKQAREDGDVAREEQLRGKLNDARATLKEPPKKEEPPKQNGQVQSDVTKLPEWDDFVAANPWWNDDIVMRTASIEISKQLAASGKLDGLSNAKRFAEIARVTKERFHMDEPERKSKVEGGRGGSARSDDNTGAKTFNDLPADVKRASERFESRLVGKKAGQFADLAAYRKHYADEYFRRNPNG